MGPDSAVVQFCEFLAEFETDAGSFFLHQAGGGERVGKDMVDPGFGDAGAGIGNDDRDIVCGGRLFDADVAARMSIFDGVGDEVANNAGEQVGVGEYGRFFGDIVAKFNVFIAQDRQVHMGGIGYQVSEPVFALFWVDAVEAGAGPLEEIVH